MTAMHSDRIKRDYQSDKVSGLPDFLDRRVLNRFPALARFAGALGNTALISAPGPRGGAPVRAKCEWDNPTGSIKDRPAFAMVYSLLRGLPGVAVETAHILEYSGGNLAISLSRLCADLGLSNTLVFGSYVPDDAVATMQDQGSETVIVDKDLGFWEVVQTAERLADAHPDWYYLHQHENQANLWMHEYGTGGEIIRQLAAEGLKPAAWVAAIGTGGTLVGVRRALRTVNPDIRVCATTPAELPYGTLEPANGLPKFDGSGGLGEGRKQPFVAPVDDAIDHMTFSFTEALAGMHCFHALTGEWIGSSAAANWLAACRQADVATGEGAVVTVFPSRPSTAEKDKAAALSLDEAIETAGLEALF